MAPLTAMELRNSVATRIQKIRVRRAPATDAEARVFRRLFFAQMEEVDVDKAGRVLHAQVVDVVRGAVHGHAGELQAPGHFGLVAPRRARRVVILE